jgi:hypothetical protein
MLIAKTTVLLVEWLSAGVAMQRIGFTSKIRLVCLFKLGNSNFEVLLGVGL